MKIPARMAWLLSLFAATISYAIAQPRITPASVDATFAPTPPFLFRTTTESRLTINGLANIGRWECSSSKIDATIDPGPGLVAFAIGGRTSALSDSELAAPTASIAVPVDSLRCAKPGMHADLLRALRHETSPRIAFELSAIESIQRLPVESGWPAYEIVAHGELLLAGQRRPLQITAKVAQEDAGRFRVFASKELRMSDYSIAPPTAFLGLIRAGDAVTITFDLHFELAAASP